MEKKGTYVLDLDGTICAQMSSDRYAEAPPRPEVIHRINQLWTDGWEIVIHTARGMRTCKGDVKLIELKYRAMTEKWLSDNRVVYDQLIFGKPPADRYVDDKNQSLEEFLAGGR